MRFYAYNSAEKMYHALPEPPVFFEPYAGGLAVCGKAPDMVSLEDAVRCSDLAASFVYISPAERDFDAERRARLAGLIEDRLAHWPRGAFWVGPGETGEYRTGGVMTLNAAADKTTATFSAAVSGNMRVQLKNNTSLTLEAENGLLRLPKNINDCLSFTLTGFKAPFGEGWLNLTEGGFYFTSLLGYADFMKYFPCRVSYAYPGAADYAFFARDGAADRKSFSLGFTLYPNDTAASRVDWNEPFSFASCFTTPYGAAISLTAEPGAGFAMPVRAAAPQNGLLVPRGDYAVADACDVICGFSGAEYIRFASGGRLSFTPHCPAYSALFPFQETDIGDFASPSERPPLDNTFDTAWTSIKGGVYYRAAERNAFYSCGKAEGRLLTPYYFSADFTAAPSPPFPITPYAGLIGTPMAGTGDFEAKVVAAVRGAALTSAIGADNNVSGACITASGCIAEIEGGSVRKITLAFSELSPSEISFSEPSMEIVSLFSSSALFAVITDDKNLGAYTARVCMDGFSFDVRPGAGGGFGGYKNVMIVKYASGDCASLSASPDLWTGAALFTDDRCNVSAFLTRYFADAASRVGDPYFDNIRAVASNPNWRGVLFLNLEADKGNLPDSMKVLTAGADGGKLSVHHLGVSSVPLTVKSDVVSAAEEPDFFGLIYERAPGFDGVNCPPIAASGTYGYTLLAAQCLFERAAVKRIETAAALTIGRMFGFTPRSGEEGAPYNAVLLKGGNVRGGDDVERFVMRKAEGRPALFSFQNGVIRVVQIDAAALTPQSAAYDRYLFALSGAVSFAETAPVDLFSYDSLRFGGFNITMDGGSFAADYGAMRFDLPSSVLRGGGLVSRFPTALETFAQGASCDGFAPLAGEPLDGETFGLRFKVNLGSLGALADAAGLGAELLLAWDAESRFFAGIAVPDKVLLENVVGLKISPPRLISKGAALCVYFPEIALQLFGMLQLPASGALSLSISGGGKDSPAGWFGIYK